MRVTRMSPLAAALSLLALLAACNDAYSPSPVPGRSGGGGLSVIPQSATIAPGQVVALQAKLIDEFGDRIEGVTVKWQSSNDAVATVAATGEVVGRDQGHVIITASALGKYQTSTIHVLAESSGKGGSGKGDGSEL